jgi:hypothetical protein
MKGYLLTTFLSVMTLTLFSQYRTDIGFNFGGANYLGEIGGKEDTRRDFIFDMKLKETKTSFGAFIRHRFNDSYGFTATLTFANIAGNDKNSSNPARNERNLNFKNLITEISGRGEYYFYSINDVGNHGRYWVNFKPYVFGGLGIFHHSPKTTYQGEVVNLRKLKTEGQNKAYSPINISIPAGVGFYFTYKNRYRLSVEMAYRKTFTDYLDDVSSSYASHENLSSDLAIELANRNDELASEDNEIEPENYEPGNKRGDDKNKDSFLTGHVGFSYVLRGPWKIEVNSRGGFRPRVRSFRAKF